jgi:hypothetical protein
MQIPAITPAPSAGCLAELAGELAGVWVGGDVELLAVASRMNESVAGAADAWVEEVEDGVPDAWVVLGSGSGAGSGAGE